MRPAQSATATEWTARIKAHQARRPAHWATIEDTDLPAVLAAVPNGSAVLLDSIGTWVTARLDALDAWGTPRAHWEAQLSTDVDRAIAAFPAQAVLVSDEVGLGGIAAHPSSRLFADVLGEVNQRVATVCDEVHLVVAGRALRLSHLRAVAG